MRKSAKAGYFAKFQPLADQLRKVSMEGGQYPLTLPQWVDTSTPLLATILDVMNGASAASETHTDELQRSSWNSVMLAVALLVVCGFLFVGSIAFAVLTMVRPLRALTTPLNEFAAGNFVTTVPGLDRGDEIGQIANAVNSMAEKVRNALVEIKASAREVNSASAEISTATTDQAEGARQITTAIEQMNAVTQQTAANSEEAASAAQELASEAERLRELVDGFRIRRVKAPAGGGTKGGRGRPAGRGAGARVEDALIF